MAEKLKSYTVTFEERLNKTIELVAPNECEAEKMARALYKSGKVVLSGDDIQERLMEVRCDDGTYCSDWDSL